MDSDRGVGEGGGSSSINQVCQITRLCYMISIYIMRGVHYPPLLAVIGLSDAVSEKLTEFGCIYVY